MGFSVPVFTKTFELLKFEVTIYIRDPFILDLFIFDIFIFDIFIFELFRILFWVPCKLLPFEIVDTLT